MRNTTCNPFLCRHHHHHH
uniref:Uncharacterized protein n=1 Tax=Anguilla anguilla TaxID=7936 RepID=A0A0E9PGR9_ANGAN